MVALAGAHVNLVPGVVGGTRKGAADRTLQKSARLGRASLATFCED